MPTPYEPATGTRPPGVRPVDAHLDEAPVAPGAPQRPPLVRDRSGGWTPGVCGAIARHLGVSRRMVRWVFVLLALAGGAGIAAYIFLWALTPEEDLGHVATPGALPEPRVSPERRRWVLVLSAIA